MVAPDWARITIPQIMKFFLNLLLALVLVALGYILYPNVAEQFGWDKKPTDTVVDQPASPDTTPDKTDVKPKADKDPEVAENDTKPDTKPSVDPGDAVPPTPKGDTTSAIAKRFPYPKIKSLDTITHKWTLVPERAFPKSITINKPLKFAIGTAGNSATKPAGSKVVPLGTSKQGNIKVAMSKGSPAQAVIAMGDTNFKEQVRKLYSQGVDRIYARVDQHRAAELKRQKTAATVPDKVKASAGAIPKSESDEDRYITIMQQDVQNGGLKGIAMDEIIEWRFVGFESVNGASFWTGVAVYPVSTMFGSFHVEAKAMIQNDKVVKWIKSE